MRFQPEHPTCTHTHIPSAAGWPSGPTDRTSFPLLTSTPPSNFIFHSMQSITPVPSSTEIFVNLGLFSNLMPLGQMIVHTACHTVGANLYHDAYDFHPGDWTVVQKVTAIRQSAMLSSAERGPCIADLSWAPSREPSSRI